MKHNLRGCMPHTSILVLTFMFYRKTRRKKFWSWNLFNEFFAYPVWKSKCNMVSCVFIKATFFLFRIKHFLLHKLNHYLTGHEGTSINWLFALSQTITRTTQFYSFARILWSKNNFVKKIPFYVDNKLMVSQKILGEIKDEERKIKIEAF